MNLLQKNCAFALAAMTVIFSTDVTLAQTIDFSKGEALGTGFVGSMRGAFATIFFSVALIVTGFLAAFNKIQWFWFFGVLFGAFLVFGAPSIVANLRSAFS